MVSEPRPEHVKAITWLNEAGAAAFYLVKVEAIKIGDSSPAHLLTLITGPSSEAVEAGTTKKELAERYLARKRFWSTLLERAKPRTKLHAGISPGQYNWIGTSAGQPGLNFNYVIRRHDGQVELYIDTDKEKGDGNRKIFDTFLARKKEIEDAVGEPLDWEPLEGRRACRIRKTIPSGGWRDEDKWPRVQEAMVDAMVRLERAIRPHLKKL